MTVMGIAPAKPAEINIQNMLMDNAAEIEKGLKENLPKMFENLATLKIE